MSFGNKPIFDDKRICKECGKSFLYATEITEHIEGKPNPEIYDEVYEGFYCFGCIENIENRIESKLTGDI